MNVLKYDKGRKFIKLINNKNMNNNLSSSVHKKIFLFGILSFLIIAITGVLFSANGKVIAATSSQTVKATLTTPVSLPELANAAKLHGAKISELHYVQGDIQGGYTVQMEETIDNAINNFRNAHNTFLATAITKTEEELSKTTDTETLQRLSGLHGQLISAQAQTNKEGLKVDSIESNDEQSLDRLKGAGFIKNVLPKQSTGQKISSKLQNTLSYGVTKLINTAEASYWHELWAPYGGGSDVQRTYTYQTFYFNDISSYGSADTYEQETQVYDKNFADYAGYWSSNMPSAYYDTPFSDSIDNFTIGTFTGASLQTYTQYYTYMSLTAGSASTATVRIKGQKGHRSPSWCYSTWCVFADATTGTMALHNPAPSGMSWQY